MLCIYVGEFDRIGKYLILLLFLYMIDYFVRENVIEDIL